MAKKITTVTFARGADSSIATDGLSLGVIRRADKIGLRMRDPQSPNRTGFKGLKYFPINPAYRIKAAFTPYDKLKPVPVPNVLGQLVSMESPGYVEFTIKGKTYRLEPVYETSRHEDLFFIFKDLTSKTDTYEAGRFLHAPLAKDGIVDLGLQSRLQPAVCVHRVRHLPACRSRRTSSTSASPPASSGSICRPPAA